MEKALKERIDRRKRQLEAKHKKDISDEQKQREADIRATMEAEKAEKI